MLAKQVRKKVESQKLMKVEKKTESIKKPKQKKKKRLIIRNLSFKVDQAELKKVFSKFGNVVDVQIPLQQDGKKKGFGFVEFDNTKSLIQAMKSMNYKEILGRKVAVDFAVDKTTYQLKVKGLREENQASKKDESELKTSKIKSEDLSEDEDEDVEVKEEESEEDEDEKRLNAFLKEFDSGADALTKSKSSQKDDASDSSSDESSLEESSDNESEDDEESLQDQKPKRKFSDKQDTTSKKLKKDSHDTSEGKTVFIRNVSFTSSEDSLKEALEEFGECKYCLLCMDQFTDHPKGTAFIQYKEKNSADRLIKESINEPGVIVDGRKLSCSIAISRDEVTRLGDDTKTPKDKRNLNLLRASVIMAGSKESKGVSPSDISKRSQLEISKKMKLKNVNFFVSDTRLTIHNIPNKYSDGELRKLFKNAAGPGAVITEARIMKEFKKIDAEGQPVSKGFGFVTFTKHEDALTALKKLNNNPEIFTSQKRPIVEFTIENRVAILSKERRKEKAQLRNKRRTEEKKERQLQQNKEDAEKTSDKKGSPKKKNKKNKSTKKPENIQQDHELESSQITKAEENSTARKQKKKGRSNKDRKGKNKATLKSRQTDVSDLVHKYKDKLKNKIT